MSAAGGVSRGFQILERCDLRHVGRQNFDLAFTDQLSGEFINLGSFGSVRLPRSDPRLARLIAELRAAGVEPFTRVDRSYSTKDRASALWVLCCHSTTMVLAGNHPKQQWDVSTACPTCGAGAIPVPPLFVKFKKKNKIGWAATCPFGLIVVSQRVAERLAGEQLTGFKIHPVRTPRSKAPDPDWRWLRIVSTWPRYSKRTVVELDQPCPSCDRRGRFDSMKTACEIHYRTVPAGTQDFNVTSEQWGYYDSSDGGEPHGASPRAILSPRAYSVLLDEGVKLSRIEPLFIDGETA